MDNQFKEVSFKGSYQEHLYGENVKLLSDPVALSLLAKLGDPKTEQPLINRLVEQLYHMLIQASVSEFFPRKSVKQETRMKQIHPAEGYYQGEIIDPETSVVSVNLARAGTLPSYICYDYLHYFLEANGIRQDHFICERQTNEQGEVIGVDISGSKIGGDVSGKIVLFPDPMGATGGTICRAVEAYKNTLEGSPAKIIALHLIVTPEYINRVRSTCPEVQIMALRLDRGLSDPEILKTIPGTHIEKEKGLNDTQYIVPGAGGLGEILNNAYV